MADQDEKSEDLRDKVEQMTTRNFYVSSCPEKVYKRFVEYAIRETGNNYSMAIKQLLDIAEGNAKDAMLYEKITRVEERVALLEEEVFRKERKTGPVTMGRKR